jgi:Uma2 family endonuclease
MSILTIDLPAEKSYHAFNLRRWKEVCEDETLAQIPGKFETNRHGNIIMMPPASGKHSSFQGEILYQLRKCLGGKALAECPISTINGVRAADVGWYSEERFSEVRDQVAFTRAPEICVEVISPSNSQREMDEKIALYFEAGAEEVWVCTGDGEVGFYHKNTPAEVMNNSSLCREFPSKIEL